MTPISSTTSHSPTVHHLPIHSSPSPTPITAACCTYFCEGSDSLASAHALLQRLQQFAASLSAALEVPLVLPRLASPGLARNPKSMA